MTPLQIIALATLFLMPALALAMDAWLHALGRDDEQGGEVDHYDFSRTLSEQNNA